MAEDSFLHEAQKSGQGNGDYEVNDIDQAILDINKILVPEACNELRSVEEADLPTIMMDHYCHDCRNLVEIEMKTVGKGRRKKSHKSCNVCGGQKISSGRREALINFYHIDKVKVEEFDKSIKDN